MEEIYTFLISVLPQSTGLPKHSSANLSLDVFLPNSESRGPAGFEKPRDIDLLIGQFPKSTFIHG